MKANKITAIITAALIGAATTFTVVENKPPREQTTIHYEGDEWEQANLINNGLFTDIWSSGDIIGDLSLFLFHQGGGKSRDLKDPIVHKPNAWPPVPDKDGYKYHTVNDITWLLFSDKKVSQFAGYTPTAKLFYEMPDSIRRKIIVYHIQQASVTTSICVNLVFTYSMWGGGGYKTTLYRFEQKHGNIEKAIDSCEYFVFYKCLQYRQEIMKERNAMAWPRYGRGWSNGLANFHRVFKHYTRLTPLNRKDTTMLITNNYMP